MRDFLRTFLGFLGIAVSAVTLMTILALLGTSGHDTTTGVGRIVQLPAAYGDPPEPTPTPCPHGCPNCCSYSACEAVANENNWSEVSADGIMIGYAARKDMCTSYALELDNSGVYSTPRAPVEITTDAADYDAFCTCSESHDGLDPELYFIEEILPPDEGGLVTTVTGLTVEMAGSVCSCGVVEDEEHPVSHGTVYIYEPVLKVEYPDEEAVKNGDIKVDIEWGLTPGLPSTSCGKPPLRTFQLVITGGGLSKTINIPEEESGAVTWDGYFDDISHTPWTAVLPVNVAYSGFVDHLAVKTNEPGCVTEVGPGFSRNYCEECIKRAAAEGGGCGGGSAGGFAGMTGGSVCPLFNQSHHPFYDYTRDTSVISPFGTDSPLAGDAILKYIKISGSTLSLYVGGSKTSSLNADGTNYRNGSGDIGATEVTVMGVTYIDWERGSAVYRFVKPSGSEAKFLQKITYTDSGETDTYSYGAGLNGGRLTSIVSTEHGTTTVTWDSDVIDYITFPDGTKEEFEYDSGELVGFKEYISTTLLTYTTWEEDAYDRISKFEKRATTTPFGVVASNDFAYTSSTDNRVTDFEKYNDNYDVTWDSGTRKKTITAPDTSWVEHHTRINSSTKRVRRTSVHDTADALLSRTDTETDPAGLVKAVTNGEGEKTTYWYERDENPGGDIAAADLVIYVTQPLGNYSHYQYDEDLRLERLSEKSSGDTELAYTQYDYDSEDRVTKTYTGSLSETFHLYQSDNLRRITDGASRKNYFGYNGDDQLVAVGDGSATTTFVYDGDGRLTTTESPLGIETFYEYEPINGNLRKVHNAYGTSEVAITEYKYDLSNYGRNLTEVIDAESRKTTYEYDAWDRLDAEKVWSGGSPVGTIDYRYAGEMGEYLRSKVDMNGHKTAYTYLAPGFVDRTTWYKNVSGTTSEWGYIEYDYDLAGRLDTITTDGGDCDCDTSPKTLTYTDNGQIDTRTASHAGTIDYGYDGISRLNQIQIPDKDGTGVANTVGYTYDAANRIYSVQSSTVTDFSINHNKANQITQIEADDLDGADINYQYDSVNGRVTQIKYDPNSNTENDTQVDYVYNADGLRTKATHDTARITTYMYDKLNRLTYEAGHAKWGSESCISLNGSQSISIASGAPLGSDHRAFSVEARILLDTYPAGANLAKIFERGSQGSENWFRFYVDSSGILRANIETQDTDESVAWILKPLPLGEWIHVAATWYEDEKIKLYVNGIRVAQSGVAPGADLDTFAGSPTIGSGLDGKIDEVVVYGDSDPAPTDFSEDSNYGGAPTGSIDGWHFETGTGTTQTSFMSGKTATVPSGSWSNATGEPKPAVYEYRYKYDKVGNRTEQLFFKRSGSPTLDRWVLTYNALNQLTQRNHYTDALSSTYDLRWLYTYDGNGNLTIAEKQNGSNVKQEKWVYSWNPRDQMTKAEKFTGTGDTYAGKVEYFYCLSCAGALSQRKEFNSGSTTVPISWKRFEYDGLNLLRVDAKYDTGGGSIDSGDPWRTLEVATHKPGSLGAMLGKRVYTHTNNDATPDTTTDYGYVYDAVGNVISAFLDDDDEGEEAFYFVQDAFGNEVSVSPFTGDSWSTARTAGVTEHQTGKWIDPFTNLYFFHARWYESGVGRFVGRDPAANCRRNLSLPETASRYTFCLNLPTLYVDTDGRFADPATASASAIAIGLAMAALSGYLAVAIICNNEEWQRNAERLINDLEQLVLDAVDVSINMIESAKDLIRKAKDQLKRCKRCAVGKWYCKATCEARDAQGPGSCFLTWIYGYGTGPDQGTACYMASKTANILTPDACFKGHCHCKKQDCVKK